MIRMGRNSKPDTSVPQSQAQETQPDNTVNYQPRNTVAMTDSESVARDLKDGRLSGFVGHGTTLTGETTFESMLRVDGTLVGKVNSREGTLVIGSNGRVDANIQVGSAEINGEVNGDVSVADKLHLGRTSKVIGNIQAARLIIEDGAVFEGNCSMVKVKRDAKPVAEKPLDLTERPQPDLEANAA